MGLFKSSEERRLEREMKIRQGLKRIQRQIKQLEKDEKGFIDKARRAKQLGDTTQLNFIKANLKRTAATRRLMERQLLNMETFNQLRSQAEAQAEFAKNLNLISQAIGEAYGSVNLAEVHKNCEAGVMKYETMQQTLEMLMEAQSDSMMNLEGAQSDDLITDTEIDSLLDDHIVAEETKEIEDAVGSRLQALKAKVDKLSERA